MVHYTWNVFSPLEMFSPFPKCRQPLEYFNCPLHCSFSFVVCYYSVKMWSLPYNVSPFREICPSFPSCCNTSKCKNVKKNENGHPQFCLASFGRRKKNHKSEKPLNYHVKQDFLASANWIQGELFYLGCCYCLWKDNFSLFVFHGTYLLSLFFHCCFE